MINAEMSVQEKFSQGLALINSKDKDEAEKGALTILGLVIDYPKNAEIKVVYANYLWRKGDIDLAISELQDGVLASPKSEIVSLLLFQILWEQGREVEAVAEIERLYELGVDCKDYEDIIREINDRWSIYFSKRSESEFEQKRMKEKQKSWNVIKSLLVQQVEIDNYM